MDDHIPYASRLQHQEYNQAAHYHLPHAVSVSAVASQFARTNAQSGLRFGEKVQLQVIRYEDSDAASTSPYLPTTTLVLGAYVITRPPRSARPLKVLKDDGTGQAAGIVRSGTVFVRRSRAGQSDLSSDQTLISSGAMSSNGEDSSMLLTDVVNHHTSEIQMLKWYMTEIHWKREAALLKHLKSPIFIMELLASYTIPALEHRPSTYPYINALGGCSCLLSEIGPVRTPQHVRSILRSTSAAIDWCHQRGVVHLNIQPASFFVEDAIDPRAEDASWKLWDFTCARFIGEQIGVIGGGGNADVTGKRTSVLPPLNSGNQPSIANEQLYEEQQQLISGNPLPGCYTAPELLEAWREGRTEVLAEASMDSWSLGCLYYEILTGRPLFRTEADAWALVGGWDNTGPRRLQDFRVPYPIPSGAGVSAPDRVGQQGASALDPTGCIGQLMHDLLASRPSDRLTLPMTLERIY
ncbi:Cyclin-dependent kinase-like 5 [Actinomortierella wolfii]|nr:Cyclin-dependent kinase-like 5 [Actinomortierella wolfii]